MADEVYQTVADSGMLDEVTFICLSYEIIRYLELQHPDAQTGYLCYASFGNIEDLDVDDP